MLNNGDVKFNLTCTYSSLCLLDSLEIIQTNSLYLHCNHEKCPAI